MNIQDLINRLGTGRGSVYTRWSRTEGIYERDGFYTYMDYATMTRKRSHELKRVELHIPEERHCIKFYVSDLDWITDTYEDIITERCGCCNDLIVWDGNDIDTEHYFDSRDGNVCRSCYEDYKECEQCGEWFNREDDDTVYVESRSAWYCCYDCARDDDVDECECCGEWFDQDDLNEVICGSDNTEYWCYGCRDEDAFCCNRCENYFSERRYSSYDVDGETWCNSCEEDYSSTCDECGNNFPDDDMLWTEDDEHLCQHCYDMRETYHIAPGMRESFGKSGKCYKSDGTQQIYRYHGYPCDEWKQQLLSHKDYPDDLFLGIELELCNGGEDSTKASIIRHVIEQTDEHEVKVSHHIWASHDGSLSSGFELISQPANAAFHLNLDSKGYDWKGGMATAVDLGYVSHDGGLCGLHFHVNRDFFDVDDPEDNCSVILSNNSEWLKLFSRRKNYRYCSFSEAERTSFAEKEFKYKDSPDEVKAYRKIENVKNSMRGHGSAMNFCGAWTIEFRFVRGTLKYNTFVAALQMVVMFCEFANTSVETCTTVSLESFVDLAKKRDYKEFLKYLEERDIKINKFPDVQAEEVDTVMIDDVQVTSNEA